MDTHLDTALLTVSQAKYLWCPEGRSTSVEYPDHVPPPTVNRRALGGADVGCMCLGDGCMFWRWHDQSTRWQKPAATVKAEWDQVHALDGGAWLGKPDDGREWELDEDQGVWFLPSDPLPPRGYCGRAGHPHAAALVEAQLELVRYQLHDHRRAE